MYGTLMYGTLKSWRIDLRSAPHFTTFSLRLKKQVTLPSFNALILYNKISKKITSVHPENPGEQKMRAAN